MCGNSYSFYPVPWALRSALRTAQVGGLAHRNFLTGGKLNGKQVLLVYVVTFVLVAGYFYVLNP